MNDSNFDDESEIEIDLDDVVWSATPLDDEPAPAPPAQTFPPAEETDGAQTPTPPPAFVEMLTLPPAFDEIVGRVEPAAARELVGLTFFRLLRVLDTLGAIEKALARPSAVFVGSLFEEAKAGSVALLSHVTGAVSDGPRLDPRLRGVLDGMRFVIGHELTKVFQREFPRLTDERPQPPYSRAELSRAWGLLHNCFQQTAITLAQVFDAGARGAQLFEDYQARVENSVTLHRELKSLLRKVAAAQRSSGILLKHSLVMNLEHFRDETMHFLMYKDWGEFGRYVDDVKRAYEEMEEFEAVLHEFAQYLTTLIHHVGMREALRAAPPEADEVAQSGAKGVERQPLPKRPAA
jgi:hypothetical protein